MNLRRTDPAETVFCPRHRFPALKRGTQLRALANSASATVSDFTTPFPRSLTESGFWRVFISVELNDSRQANRAANHARLFVKYLQQFVFDQLTTM
jgi:hypothetical protein